MVKKNDLALRRRSRTTSPDGESFGPPKWGPKDKNTVWIIVIANYARVCIWGLTDPRLPRLVI